MRPLALAFGSFAFALFSACSTGDTSNRLGSDDAGVDAPVDAYTPPSDHGLTRSSCDADRIATDEGNLVYRTLDSGGASRSFHLLRPAGAKCTTKSALVVLVHPALSTDTVKKNPGDYYAREVLFNENATNYILVAPNALAGDGEFRLSGDNAADMTFISDLIDAVTIKEPVNPKRVYVIGFGEGGAVALQAGCSFASRVAGVSSVAGGLLKSTKASCKPSEGVSVVLAAGTKDTVVPYNGDDTYEPFTDARDFLIGAMGCNPDQTTPGSGSTPATLTYTACNTAAQIQTLQLSGGTRDAMTEYLIPTWDGFLRKRFKS